MIFKGRMDDPSQDSFTLTMYYTQLIDTVFKTDIYIIRDQLLDLFRPESVKIESAVDRHLMRFAIVFFHNRK